MAYESRFCFPKFISFFSFDIQTSVFPLSLNLFIYLKDRVKVKWVSERENLLSSSSLQNELPDQFEDRNQQLFLDFHNLSAATQFGHCLLFFCSAAGWEVEQAEFKPTPLWDTGTACRIFAHANNSTSPSDAHSVIFQLKLLALLTPCLCWLRSLSIWPYHLE